MRKTINRFTQSLSKLQRQNKIRLIESDILQGKRIIDVGVWCKVPEPNPSENWLEKVHGKTGQIIAVGLENMLEFKEKYPGVMCVQADGCALPFKTESIEVGFTNAVLEHVEESKQPLFVEEFSRVISQKGVLTVPDRLSPIEIHSKILFLHWLPYWRRVFAWLGEIYWSNSKNLASIFSASSFSRLLKKNTARGKWTIKRQTFCGLPSSLIAILKK
jgi:ubiquinone/menaquinone biosynthesis C-methylase UbiE